MADDDSYRSLGQTVSDTRDQVKRGKEQRASSGVRGALGSAGRSMQASGQSMIDRSRDTAASRIGPVQYKRGGKVRKTGAATVHKNERVIPAGKRKKVERLMKRAGMKLTNRKKSSRR